MARLGVPVGGRVRSLAILNVCGLLWQYTMYNGPKRILQNRVCSILLLLEFSCQPIDNNAGHFRNRYRGVL
jgi:hypothetical protein